MRLTDLIWIIPTVISTVTVLVVWLRGRSISGVLSIAEKLLVAHHRTEAEARFREARQRLDGTVKFTSPLGLRCLKGLAETTRRKGMIGRAVVDNAALDEALSLFQEALSLARNIGSDAKTVAEVNERLAVCKVAKADHEGALAHLQSVVEFHRHHDKSKDRDIALGSALGQFGASLYELKRYDEAEPVLREYLTLQDSEFPCGDVLFAFGSATPSLCLVHTLNATGKTSEAEALLGTFVQHCINLETGGDDGKPMEERLREVELLQVLQGRCLLKMGKRKDAEALFTAALDRRSTDLGVFDEQYDNLVQSVAESYSPRDPAAEQVVADMVANKEASSSKDDVRLLFPLQKHAEVLSAGRRYREAERVLRRACALERKLRPNVVPSSQTHLVNVLLKQNKTREARRLALEVATKTEPPGQAATAN